MIARRGWFCYNACMNAPLKIIKVGNSAGMILPKDVLSRLRVELGDSLYLSEAPDGSYRLTQSDPDFEAQMAVARDVMARRKRALRELAK